MSKLHGSINQLQSTLAANEARSGKWNEVKTLILHTFDKIKEEYPDLHLETNTGKVTRSVFISFPASRTILGNKMDSKNMMKNGARLIFVQAHNGNIAIIEQGSYFFEDDMNENQYLHNEPLIQIVDISRLMEVNEGDKFVYETFASFVDNVNQWEKENHSSTLLRMYGHVNEEHFENGHYQRERTERTGLKSGVGQHAPASRL